jgi:hypothetical protein
MPSEYKSNKFRFTRAKYCIPRKYYNKKRKKKKKKIYISNKILYLFQCCLKNSLNQMQQIIYPYYLISIFSPSLEGPLITSTSPSPSFLPAPPPPHSPSVGTRSSLLEPPVSAPITDTDPNFNNMPPGTSSALATENYK